jgi:pimeloyl-ACP methyl ester carboxylesterase
VKRNTIVMSRQSGARAEQAFPRRFTAQGTSYFEAGEGEPLVLVHGVGMRLEAWAPQIEAFAGSHRVIAVDMPGHGQSALLAKGSALPAFVDWLGRFLDEMSLRRTNLAGHSMGALVAGGAVAVFPERIKRVALLNGVYRRDPIAKAAVLARAASIEEAGIDIDGPIQRWFDDDPASLTARSLTRTWLASMDRAAYATAYGAFAGGDEIYADAWPAVRFPALFLTGRDDPNSTPAMAAEMASLAPQGYARIIEGHRHMVNLTAASQVNQLLAEWLAKPAG